MGKNKELVKPNNGKE